MRFSPTLARVATFACLAGASLPAMAQDGFRASGPPATAGTGNEQSDSVTFVIKLNDQWLQALRDGQPLKSTIPPHLIGKVTEVRIEFDTAGNPPPANNLGFNNAGVSTGTRLGPEWPAGFNSSGNPNNYATPAGSSDAVTNWNPNPSNSFRSGNATTGYNSDPGIPRFSPPGPTASATNQGLTPIVPQTGGSDTRWNPPQPVSSGQGSNWNGASGQPPATGSGNFPSGVPPHQPASGFVPPLRQPAGQPGSGGLRSSEFDTTVNGTRWGTENASALPALDQARYADSRLNGYRPPANPYPGEYGSRENGPTNPPSNPFPPRNGSLLAGYQVPAIPGQVSAGWNDYRYADRGGDLSDDALAARTAQLPSASIPGALADTGESVGTRRPGAEPVLSSESAVARFNGFLYFMLLCSIGLNIYLGFISRGFYVRYRELADELRETFATV